ncbi:MAG: cyclic-di-AMP receptor [bacterium]
MKLLIAIVNSDDSSKVQSGLTQGGYFVTKINTTGGFLKKGNTTFMIGTNDEKVEGAIAIIKQYARKRIVEQAISQGAIDDVYNPIMVEVLVGGATVFVLPIERFEKM